MRKAPRAARTHSHAYSSASSDSDSESSDSESSDSASSGSDIASSSDSDGGTHAKRTRVARRAAPKKSRAKKAAVGRAGFAHFVSGLVAGTSRAKALKTWREKLSQAERDAFAAEARGGGPELPGIPAATFDKLVRDSERRHTAEAVGGDRPRLRLDDEAAAAGELQFQEAAMEALRRDTERHIVGLISEAVKLAESEGRMRPSYRHLIRVQRSMEPRIVRATNSASSRRRRAADDDDE
jgi:histone H3/H4